MERYDVVVVGVGGMGSAALYHLARRGKRALGLERFDVPHELGSSHGLTRIIRLAYFEHPDYVPLLRSARDGWKWLEEASGEMLFYGTGVLYAGTPDGELIAGTVLSARRFGVRIEDVGAAPYRFPGFRLPSGFRVLFEPGGGVLLAPLAIRAFVGAARADGATIREDERVVRWSEDAGGVTVETDRGTYAAAHLVLAAGAWTARLAQTLGEALTVTRQVLGWVRPPDPTAFAPPAFPSWAIEDPADGLYYGFPFLSRASSDPDRRGLKVARHIPGPRSDPDAGPAPSGPADEGDFLAGIARYVPSALGPTTATLRCFYTMSPDGHFLVGPLPGHERVSVACGFSGHGFKFAPVIGEALADLALAGSTELPIGFLDPGRVTTA